MNGLKALIISLVTVFAVSACSNWDKHSIQRGFNNEGVVKVKPTNWTTFQKALQPRYAAQAKSAKSDGFFDEVPTFTMRAYRSSYGGFQLPEELIERKLGKSDKAELGAARERILAAYEKRGRLLAPTHAADAQVFFDCWMYKAEDPSQSKGLEDCKNGYLKAIAAVEKAIADANKAPAQGRAVLLNGAINVDKDNLDEECDYVDIGTGKGVMHQKKVDGECPNLTDAMKRALAALPLAPGTFVLYYETDRDVPENASGEKLPEIAKVIMENIGNRKHSEVQVNGYADRQGSEEHNVDLSKRRAERIKRLLEKNGVKAANWSINWFGETKNAVETEDGADERLNRRVEVRVR
jgi:outer membrane protein OmpA-like peptidoglycan-associated protein